MKTFILKNEKIIFNVLMILSIAFGILGIELNNGYIFFVGFGIAAGMILTGMISLTYRRWKRHHQQN